MNVYDFDKTIYAGDSTIDFYWFSLKRKPSLIRYLPTQLWGALLYFGGRIDKTRFKEKFFCFVKSVDCQQFVDAFWTKNKNKMAAWYIAQQQPDDVIISASPAFLLQPICHQLGIAHLIASEVDPKNGKFMSDNCYGAMKVTRFTEKFGDGCIENFYSDSLSDSPMAQLANHSFLIVKGNVTDWPKNNNNR